jgi:hypothetical protein
MTDLSAATGKPDLQDGPAVPASVAEQPSDEELDELYFDLDATEVQSWRAYARAVLARWGHLPREEETSIDIEVTNPWKDAVFDALICSFLLNEENASDPKKALRDLLAWESELARDPLINPPPQPIPVSERLPEVGDCDAEGMCWWGRFGLTDWSADWTLATPEAIAEFCEFLPPDVWLPAHALPLPKEVE